MPGPVYQDIPRLNVPMDDAVVMGIFQGQGHVANNLGNSLGRQRCIMVAYQVCQRDAIYIIHREIICLANNVGLVDIDDIRMLEFGCGPGLAHKPGSGFNILQNQGLKRNLAIEHGIPGQIDRAHTALAQFLYQPILAESFLDWLAGWLFSGGAFGNSAAGDSDGF